MPQSLAQIYLHIVFSTKYRQPLLKDPDLRKSMHAYVAGICKNLGCPALIVGGVADHLHALVRLSRKITVSDLHREIKRDSSKAIKSESPTLRHFQWQAGYGAFSVSPSHVDALKIYIANQEEHHRTETYQDEFRRLCRIYGVDIDERYVWD